MDRRRALSRAYRERERRGGVYRIVNTANARYLLDHTLDVASVRNRFEFAVTTGSAVHPRLRQDWHAHGPSAFTLEVLDELTQAPDQSQADFVADLEALEQLWRAQFDATQAY
jgi:hypothetical protein